MKKLLALVLVFGLGFGLVGCGGDTKKTPDSKKPA